MICNYTFACKGTTITLFLQKTLWFLLVLLLSLTKSTNNFSSYLEVLRIPCTSKEKLLMDNSSTQKAVTCDIVLRFHTNARHMYKKAGLHCCCSASQGPGIAYHLNKQHRSPRRYVRSRTHLPTVCTDMCIHTPRTSKCCNVLGDLEFSSF